MACCPQRPDLASALRQVNREGLEPDEALWACKLAALRMKPDDDMSCQASTEFQKWRDEVPAGGCAVSLPIPPSQAYHVLLATS